MKTILLTSFALTAFAANSVLNRLALGEGAIDAASFTVIRLVSGVVALFILMKLVGGKKESGPKKRQGSWLATGALFLYVITFSYAYIYLDTGIGALILFGAVQITMILVGSFTGSKLQSVEWLGVLMAFAGFIYLVFPSLSTPSLVGFILMTIAGVSWGAYTLLGRGCAHPLGDTAHNFYRTLPFALILLLVTFQFSHVSTRGFVLAALSGSIASGLGYAIWYVALAGLSTTRAAVVQLLVPVIAAAGGLVFGNEAITQRLVLASLMILGGVMAVLLSKRPSGQAKVEAS